MYLAFPPKKLHTHNPQRIHRKDGSDANVRQVSSFMK